MATISALISFVFAVLVAASELQLAISEGWRATHLLAGGMATMLALLCATSSFLERRIFAEGWGSESKMIGSAMALAVGWQLYFVIFLAAASIGLAIAAVAEILRVSEADFSVLILNARRSAAACAVVSVLPPIVLLIATSLGFKPHEKT